MFRSGRRGLSDTSGRGPFRLCTMTGPEDGTHVLRGLSIFDRTLIVDTLRDLGEVYVAHVGVQQHFKEFSTLVHASALVFAYHKLVRKKSRTSAKHEDGDTFDFGGSEGSDVIFCGAVFLIGVAGGKGLFPGFTVS